VIGGGGSDYGTAGGKRQKVSIAHQNAFVGRYSTVYSLCFLDCEKTREIFLCFVWRELKVIVVSRNISQLVENFILI